MVTTTYAKKHAPTIGFIMTTLEAEFDKTLKELREEYKETLDTAEKRNEQFLELLKEEVDLDFYRFKIEEMPESLLGTDLDIMFDLVDEE